MSDKKNEVKPTAQPKKAQRKRTHPQRPVPQGSKIELDAKPFWSVPVQILRSACASEMEVIVETTTGYCYRGWLQSTDDTLNLHMARVTVSRHIKPNRQQQLQPPPEEKDRLKFVQQMPQVMLRGGMVSSVVLPQQLADTFKTAAKQVSKWVYKARREKEAQIRAKKRQREADEATTTCADTTTTTSKKIV